MQIAVDTPKYLTQEEVKKLFDPITSPRDRALFALIYYYGLRVSEAVSLTLHDVDFKRNKIIIRRLKGGVSGEMPLWRHTAEIMRAYLRSRIPKGSAVFTGRQGPLTRRRVGQLFQYYARRADLKGYKVHSLRHSIAVHLLDAGQPLELISDHLGHKKLANTQIYARISNPRRDRFFQEVEYHPAVVRV